MATPLTTPLRRQSSMIGGDQSLSQFIAWPVSVDLKSAARSLSDSIYKVALEFYNDLAMYFGQTRSTPNMCGRYFIKVLMTICLPYIAVIAVVEGIARKALLIIHQTMIELPAIGEVFKSQFVNICLEEGAQSTFSAGALSIAVIPHVWDSDEPINLDIKTFVPNFLPARKG
jgi:hypothetical protein